jgi:hypothetical protein
VPPDRAQGFVDGRERVAHRDFPREQPLLVWYLVVPGSDAAVYGLEDVPIFAALAHAAALPCSGGEPKMLGFLLVTTAKGMPMAEWILVLVFITPRGGPPLVTNIGGFKSMAACEATIENARKTAEARFGVSPEAARTMFLNSFCVERAK